MCDRLFAGFAMMAAFPDDTSQASVSRPIGGRPSSRKGEAFDAHPHSGWFISRRAARAGQAHEPRIRNSPRAALVFGLFHFSRLPAPLRGPPELVFAVNVTAVKAMKAYSASALLPSC